jgi:hypothetical protein
MRFGTTRSERLNARARAARPGGGVTLALAAAIIAGGFAVCLYVDYPGHFPPDSIWQLAQGRLGRFNEWHPPAMAWLLGLADRVSPGAWPFVAGEAALFFGGLFAFVALERRPRPIVLPLLALWLIAPVVVITQGVALKDVLFADALVAGFAAIAWSGRAWRHVPARLALALLGLSLLDLAALTRQNGFFAPAYGAVSLGVIAAWQGGPVRAACRRAAVWALTAGACAAIGLAAVSVSLSARSDHTPQNAYHLEVLQVYDLAGMIRRRPDLPLPILEREQPAVARFLRRDAAPHYRSASVDDIAALPRGEEMTTPPGTALGRQWLQAMAADPGLYLAVRWAVWRQTLETPGPSRCPMIIVGVDSYSPLLLRQSGLALRDSDQDDADYDYASRFLGAPLYSHVFYLAVLALSLLAGLARWRRGDRSPGLIAAFGLGATALTALASYAVISVACDYRFLYFVDAAAIALSVREAAARGPERA